MAPACVIRPSGLRAPTSHKEKRSWSAGRSPSSTGTIHWALGLGCACFLGTWTGMVASLHHLLPTELSSHPSLNSPVQPGTALLPQLSILQLANEKHLETSSVLLALGMFKALSLPSSSPGQPSSPDSSPIVGPLLLILVSPLLRTNFLLSRYLSRQTSSDITTPALTHFLLLKHRRHG